MIPGIMASHKAASASDPHWSNVVLLMHMDDTGLTDQKSHSITKVGGADRSSTQSLFGGYSCYFDGTGDGLTIPGTTDFSFGSSEFSIEFGFYINANSAADGSSNRHATVFGANFPTSGSYPNSWSVLILGNSSSTGTGFGLTAAGGDGVEKAVFWTTSITQSGWHRGEIARDASGNFYGFIDGYLKTISTNTIGTSMQITCGTTYNFNIGRIPYTGYLHELNGYLDELRITKVCRHTSNYGPNSVAFPDS